MLGMWNLNPNLFQMCSFCRYQRPLYKNKKTKHNLKNQLSALVCTGQRTEGADMTQIFSTFYSLDHTLLPSN